MNQSFIIKRKEKQFTASNYNDAFWLARVIAGDCLDVNARIEVYLNNTLLGYATPDNRGGVWVYDYDGKLIS